jgi:hypothetical protein
MSKAVSRTNVGPHLQLALVVALAIGIASSSTAAGSDRNPFIGQWKRYRHTVYSEPPGFPNTSCRVGWWQTLRYGHVRPRWSMICNSRLAPRGLP